jgi:hypothetical protein
MTDYQSVYSLKRVKTEQRSIFHNNPDTIITREMVERVNRKLGSPWTPEVHVGLKYRKVNNLLRDDLDATYPEEEYHPHNAWNEAREQYLSAEDPDIAEVALEAMLQHVTMDYPKLEEDDHPAAVFSEDRVINAVLFVGWVIAFLLFIFLGIVGFIPMLIAGLTALVLSTIGLVRSLYRSHHEL